MKNNYQIFHRKQDIGKRISLLHREEQLAVGILDCGTPEELMDALDAYLSSTRWGLYVMMHEEQGRIPELRSSYPDVTFIVFSNPPALGAQVNAMADECYTTYFFITRSDLRIVSFDDSGAIKLLKRSDHPAIVTPVLTNKLQERLPCIQAPMLRAHQIESIPFFPDGTILPTLYPFQGLGFYERALFQRLRGYDEAIQSDYYQCLDLGIRCWLFGYPVMNHPTLVLNYFNHQSVIEDRSDPVGMQRCHTKALGVRQINGKNYTRRWGKLTDSRILHTEVKKRLALYKTDFFQLVDQWKAPKVLSE
jgi:nitrogen regulatory protein PII-like uncharacterized protein